MFKLYYRLEGEERSETTAKPARDIKYLEKRHGKNFVLIKIVHIIR